LKVKIGEKGLLHGKNREKDSKRKIESYGLKYAKKGLKIEIGNADIYGERRRESESGSMIFYLSFSKEPIKNL
jgi:hypothetical protein